MATEKPKSKLEMFVKKAKELGATCVEFVALKPDTAFNAFESAPYGGCGSRGCRCSPGIWVSAVEGNQGFVAHFGKDWQRGGDGTFTPQDFHAWEALVEYAHKL